MVILFLPKNASSQRFAFTQLWVQSLVMNYLMDKPDDLFCAKVRSSESCIYKKPLQN
jgi:hypothetical protein